MVYETARLVGARERKRKETGKKVGGRRSHAELWPEIVAEAREPSGVEGKAGRLSYREISVRLKEAGYYNVHGRPFSLQSVRAMIEGLQPRQERCMIEHGQGECLPYPRVTIRPVVSAKRHMDRRCFAQVGWRGKQTSEQIPCMVRASAIA